MARLGKLAPWIAGFTLLLAAYSFFLPPPGPNELSRYDLLLSLARDHTVTIDAYHRNTFDKATLGEHHYTDKAIGTSLLGLPWWWVADRFYGFGEYGQVRTDFPLWVATTGAVSLPSALLVLLLYWAARELTGDRRRSFLIAGAYAFGTIAFPFATMFYGHGPAAALGFAAFAAALFWQRRRPERSGVLVLAGILAAFAAVTEYPAAIVAGLVWLYTLAIPEGRRAWPAYPVGLLLGILPLAMYSWAAFGAPWKLGYGYVADPSFSGMGAGLMGVTWPKWDALRTITIGEAGLFVRSPFLLLAAPGFVLWWLGGRYRREALFCAGVALAFLLYNAGYYLPMGGHVVGPRFLLPGLPFLALGLVGWRRSAWWLIGPLAAASAALMLMITAALPKVPSGRTETMLLYWWEHFRSGQVAPTWGNLNFGLTGRDSLGPLLGLLAIGALVTWLWHGNRLQGLERRWGTLGLAVLTYFVVAGPGGHVMPVFKPPLLQPAELQPAAEAAARSAARPGEARQLSIRYGDEVELLGYRLERRETHPGDKIALTLFWRTGRPLTEDYTVFVHLLDKEMKPIGSWDTVPGAGAYPTTMWRPGEVVAETYWVPVAKVLDAPLQCRIEVGLYRFTSGQRLAAVGLAGEKLGDSVLLTRIPVRGKAPGQAGATPLGADLGGQVQLLSYRQEDGDPAKLRGRLFWQAGDAVPAKDYTVFVQALRDGQVVAQWDNQPREGAYPASLWKPREVVEDWFALPLDAGARQGITLVAGMYSLDTMERLSVGDGTFVELPMQ